MPLELGPVMRSPLPVQLAERLKTGGLRGRNALRFETVSKTTGSCLVLVRQQTKTELKGCHLRVADLSQSGESQGGRERPPLRRRCPRRTRSPAILGTLCRRGFGGFRGWAPAGTLAGPRFDLVGDSEQEPDLCETKCKGAYLVLLDARRILSFFGTQNVTSIRDPGLAYKYVRHHVERIAKRRGSVD